MTAYETYCHYLAIKKHFTEKDYDYFKYNGKIRTSQKAFDARKDKLFFQKLAKHNDVLGFLVSNLSVNNNAWIRDLAYSEQAEEVYTQWQKRNQSLTYIVKNDINKLSDDLNEELLVPNNDHPKVLKEYLSEEITLETLCVISTLTGAVKYWDKRLGSDPIWSTLGNKVKKYTPFLKYDKDKMRQILLDKYK